MKLLASVSLLALSLGAAQAQSLDCAGLANSAGSEPAGYAQQCQAGVVPQPTTAPAPAAPTDTAFTVDLRGQAPRPPNTLYSFVLNAFSTQTARGATQPSLFGMDFNPAGTTLYAGTGAAATPNPSSYGTVNTTTGAFTLLGPITGLTAGDSLTDLVINPSTGAAFVSAAGGTPPLSRLYSFNLATGAATLIGTITAPTDATGTLMIDLAINCAGQMYAHNISDDSLYTVNTVTAAGTRIGGHGLAANFAQGMDFDAQDGTLYAFIYTGGGTNRFGTFNLATGAFTTLVQDNPLGEYEGAIPTTCGPVNADVSITKTAPAGPFTVGAALNYTLTVANAGPAAAAGVVVTDTLPAQVTYVSNSCGAAISGSTVTWTIGALANGANQTCTINTTVNATGTISNTATVATSSTDPTPGNNSSTATVTGGPATSDLSLTKTATPPATFAIGAPITYTLTVANAGPSAATAVVVTDPLPSNTTYVSNTCGATAAGNTVTWNVGTLAAAANATCSITVTIRATGSIANSATVASASTDPVPANNTGTVVLGGVAAPVLPVPATSWQTLLLLALGVLALGAMLQRRA
jgi:large repetitive protein